MIQVFEVCEAEDIELGRKIHCLDLKSNEWHIAALQIYENLFRMEARESDERGELKFDAEGNLIAGGVEKFRSNGLDT